MTTAKHDFEKSLESDFEDEEDQLVCIAKAAIYISELEELLKESITDKDILKYDNMKLEAEKAELIEALRKCLLSSDHYNLCECESVLNKYKEN